MSPCTRHAAKEIVLGWQCRAGLWRIDGRGRIGANDRGRGLEIPINLKGLSPNLGHEPSRHLRCGTDLRLIHCARRAQSRRYKSNAGRQPRQAAQRMRGEYGKSLLRRGELVERSFAHCYDTGEMRRCHLRGQENILKRQLVHVGAFNLSLILRQLLGAGTPRELKNLVGQVFCRLLRFLGGLGKAVSRIPLRSAAVDRRRDPSSPCRTPDHRPQFLGSSTTGS
jgi:hypothetical protein